MATVASHKFIKIKMASLGKFEKTLDWLENQGWKIGKVLVRRKRWIAWLKKPR